jgi:hypothetical protein
MVTDIHPNKERKLKNFMALSLFSNIQTIVPITIGMFVNNLPSLYLQRISYVDLRLVMLS